MGGWGEVFFLEQRDDPEFAIVTGIDLYLSEPHSVESKRQERVSLLLDCVRGDLPEYVKFIAKLCEELVIEQVDFFAAGAYVECLSEDFFERDNVFVVVGGFGFLAFRAVCEFFNAVQYAHCDGFVAFGAEAFVFERVFWLQADFAVAMAVYVVFAFFREEFKCFDDARFLFSFECIEDALVGEVCVQEVAFSGEFFRGVRV